MYPQQQFGFQNNGALPYSYQGPAYPAVDPSRVPVLNFQASQAMFQLIPHLQMRAIDDIQQSAGNNPIRAFFFNQMAENGFQNQSFLEFMQKLTELTEMAIVANPQIPVEAVCANILQLYTQFKAVSNLQTFPQLAQVLDQGALQRANQVFNEFQAKAQAIEQAAMRVRQQSSFGGGMQRQAVSPGWADCASRQASFSTQPQGAHIPAWKRADAINAAAPAANVAFAQPEKFVPSWQKSQVATAAKAVVSEAEPSELKSEFVRSDAVPYDIVYDHNVYEKAYEYVAENVVKPYVRRKAMDRELHLGKPSFAPSWAKPVSAESLRSKLSLAENSDVQDTRAIEFIKDDDLNPTYPSGADSEQWVKSASFFLANRSTSKKIVCAMRSGVVVESFITPYDLLPLCKKLLITNNPNDAIAIIRSEEVMIGDNIDGMTAVRAIVNRITERVNRFIKNEAALEYGDITDYIEDSTAQLAMLEEVYGAATKQIYLDNHRRIISDAVLTMEGESGDTLSAPYLDKLSEDSRSKMQVVHLVEMVGYAQIDLSSTELCFSFPQNTTVACGVLESSSPLLYTIIHGIFDEHDLSSSGCMRQMLRTSDGVVFELERGAFNRSFFLIKLVK